MSAPKDQEEHDALSAFLLRQRVSGFHFSNSGLYRCTIDANWTYRTRDGVKYYPPNNNGNDSIFAGLASDELQARLDQHAIPRVSSSSLEALPSMPPQMSERDAALRKDLMTRYYHKRKEKRVSSRDEADVVKGQTFTSDSKQDEEEKKEEVPEQQRRELRPRKRPNPSNNNASVTVVDKGADMYMRKGKKNSKKQFTEQAEKRVRLDMPLPSKSVKDLEQTYSSASTMPMTASELDECTFLLSTDRSLLFYGFGSKIHILNTLANRLKKEGDVLTIQGYDQEVTMDGILDIIVDLFLEGKEPEPPETNLQVGISIGTHNMVRRAVAVSQELRQNRKRPLYLVIHNVDGVGLKHPITQQALAALVSNSTVTATGTRAVRLVASIDHVNSMAALWNMTASSSFAWDWKEVHTHQPYFQEIKMGLNDKDFKKTKLTTTFTRKDQQDDSNLADVLTSLAPRHAEALQVLARLQLDKPQAVDFVAWREHCKYKLVAPNDTTLRGYLNELRDHGIIQVILDQQEGTERLWIPHSNEKLHEILGFEVQKK